MLRARQSAEADGLCAQHPDRRTPPVILIASSRKFISPAPSTLSRRHWFPQVRVRIPIGQTILGSVVDDPDQHSRDYACGSDATTPAIATPDLESNSPSSLWEGRPAKRRQLVWEIDNKLGRRTGPAIIYHFRAGTCWQPKLNGLTIMATASTTAGASKTSGSTSTRSWWARRRTPRNPSHTGARSLECHKCSSVPW